MVDIELPEARSLLEVCTRMMNTIRTFLKSSSQRCMHLRLPPDARWCRHVTWQLLLSRQGLLYREGRGGLFCNTPLVAVARQINRKHAMEHHR